VKWPRHLAVVLLALSPAATEAHHDEGPPSISVAGRQLVLNGVGVRRWLIFDVYEAALYLEQPSALPSVILSSRQIKRLELKLFHGVGRDSLVEIIHRALLRNSAEQMEVLQARLVRLDRAVRDVRRGDRLSITYVPGSGTEIAQGAEAVWIEGDDFAQALFSVWLGDNPIDGSLKRRLLSSR
jgi:hypothetical protein